MPGTRPTSSVPPALAPPAPTLARAAERLADWGFLADPDLPDRPGPASLIVALRPSPTLRHYDPEVVEFWSTFDGRGSHQAITWQTPMPISAGVAWGEIRILDRLGESNGYLGFGGQCDAAMFGDTVIVAFTSPAPILRRGGHSQGWDNGADAIGAFFGRLLVTVDYVPGFEARLAEASPLARYSAFVQDADGRDRRMRTTSGVEPPFAATLRAEVAALHRDHPDAWREGAELLADIGRT